MDELHRISNILIERETIDKEQFLRLLAGDAEEEVFPEESPAPSPGGKPADEPRRTPKPRPFPIPGATMQPPAEPEPGT
jgi:cell division protease FtsH